MRPLSLAFLLLLVAVASAGGESPRDRLLRDVTTRATRDGGELRERLSVSDLVLLYGDEAKVAGISRRELVDVYERAYESGVEGRTWLQRLRPHGGWIVVLLSVIALFFHETLKSLGARVWRKLKQMLYGRLARTRLYQFFALARYREKLSHTYKRVEVPFLPEPLAMAEIYVPLLLKDSAKSDPIEAVECLGKYRRIMVTGNPGAGKSMLVKSLAYRYSVAGGAGRAEVPVLVELHRTNDMARPLEELIADTFARNGFRGASEFVSAALISGGLTLLFDGLDEVATTLRGNVIRQIRDLLHQYPDCRVVITSRGAVYEGELAGAVDATFGIADFNDQQVRRFLDAWPHHLPVQHVMEKLGERPHIMALARTPLLLTIVAFLYSKKGFDLPRSRAEFYNQALDVLLNSWQRGHHRYHAHDKRALLEALALRNHELATANPAIDRRTLTERDVLRQIQRHLQAIGLRSEKPRDFLDEIIERSGILARIDGGTRCQFAHLTLQEFLAASALLDDPGKLLSHYDADRDVWREVVTLWCGLAQDSTSLILEIEKRDPLLAFACLGDAHHVDERVAARIVGSFQARFESESQDDSVVPYFAAAASEESAQGGRTLAFLGKLLASPRETTRRKAATVLAQTNSRAAATVLAANARGNLEAQEALGSMADVALGAIVASDSIPTRTKLGLFYSIGTPLAAERLVSHFWTSEDAISRWAAAYLIAMLPHVGVPAALDTMGYRPHEHQASWVWEPFAAAEGSSLAAIINRAAYVILTDPEDLPEVKLDERVAMALLVQQRLRDSVWSYQLSESRTLEELQRLRTRLTGRPPARDETYQYSVFVALLSDLENGKDIAAVDEVLAILLAKNPRLHALLRRVKPDLRGSLAARLLRYPQPDLDDWRNVRKPVDYRFNRGVHLGTVLLLMLGAFATGALGLYTAGHVMAAGLGALAVLAVGAAMLFRPDSREDDLLMGLTVLVTGPLVSLKEVFVALRKGAGIVALGWLVGFALTVAVDLAALALLYSALSLAARYLSWTNAGTTFGGLTIIALLLWYLGKRRNRAARNPLHGLLQLDTI
jgi:hypothetical protein